MQSSGSTAPVPGAIGWTGADFHGWNGTKWVSMTTGVAFYNQVTDIDGNVYQTIKIGTQEWMAENLRTSKYRTGAAIPHVTDDNSWTNANYGAGAGTITTVGMSSLMVSFTIGIWLMMAEAYVRWDGMFRPMQIGLA